MLVALYILAFSVYLKRRAKKGSDREGIRLFTFISWHYIVEFYGLATRFEYIKLLYNRYDAWAVGIAGFTPIPYKVFTISAGAFNINFLVFVIASLISRSARFFLVGGLIYVFGNSIRNFIDKYFNLLVTAFTILLVAGFLIIKYLL